MTATFTGGTPYPPQQRALRNGIDILIGTPGRIIDHLENGELDLTGLSAVVLDEADEVSVCRARETEGADRRRSLSAPPTHTRTTHTPYSLPLSPPLTLLRC